MKIKNSVIAVLAGFMAFIAISGCDDSISADVNEEFFIAPGQKAEIRESDLEITFNRVIEDSRCPKGVECVWAGNGKVEISIQFDGTEFRVYELNTSLEPDEIKAGNYRIRLLKLQPYPVKDEEILPEKYRILLVVKK